MALFTAIAAAIGLTGFFAAAFVTVASIATSIGVSYLAKALAGDPKGEAPQAVAGVQGVLQSGADIPRSFNLGHSVTAGSLVYANTWGRAGGDTPNAFLTQVIALSDLPGGDLVEVWINGELCTLDYADTGPNGEELGNRVTEYVKDGSALLWVKYYDGTQTAADSLCVDFASSVDRPYESTRVGTGVAYVVVTSLVNDTKFSGFPTFKWAVSGVPLYDPTKDSTNGGTGSHRWSDRSTWGGDGDSFPAVQAYNILRGIYLNGTWLYGLQRMTAARLPAVNWNAQIEKCRATVTGTSGSEPTYRTGGQVPVNVQPVQIIEQLLTGCQGRLSEIGGFYKIHVGAPDTPTFAFTDDDILSTEEQHYSPFFGLSDSVNGIVATYPSPAEGWAMKPAPPLYNPDYEAEDGDRRLLANPSIDFVPYDAQVQRLQKSALLEARRARRHDLTLPPSFWIVEPGDVGEWTSERNGYSAKQFRADGVTDRDNLDVLLSLTEVDPTDYDWDHDTEFTPVVSGPTTSPRPAPQGILDWSAEAFELVDGSGLPRRPAIRLQWDGTVPGVAGVQYEVRLQSDSSDVAKGRTDQLAAAAIIVSQSLLPNTVYQVRGQYIPSTPRDMLWSSWIDVTTPDIRLSLLEFDAAIRAQVTTIQDAMNDRLGEIEQRLATLTSAGAARSWLEKKEVRSQLSARSEFALAEIEEVRTVAVDTETAFASFSTTATATFGSTTAFVAQTAAAIAEYDGWGAAQYAVTLNVDGYATGFNLVNGGPGTSSCIVVADKFQIQLPSYSGGVPVSVFTTGLIGGVPSIGISGNLFLDGTLNASKIVAGSINTAQLAVNSVDIVNIIDGAVSNTDAATGTTSSPTMVSVASKTVSIAKGRAIVLGLLNTLATSGIAGRIKVDGVVVQEGISRSPQTGTNVFGPTFGEPTPIPFIYYATGLSTGNHTFTLEGRTDSGTVTGTIVVINLRN